jgi:phage tail sheath gpL-like
MPISFSQIPADLKIPLYWVEVDPSKAGLPVLYQPSLLVGIMRAATKKVGTAAVAAGGSGYVVGDTISLDNDIHLVVATVTGGAVTTTTVTSGGSIPATTTPPANPVPQFSTGGAGTGATFNLTWIDDIAEKFQEVSAANIAAGGTGYAANDTITLGNDVHLRVVAAAAGVVTSVAVIDNGSLPDGATPPTNPVPQVSSSGAGTGATFNLQWLTVTEVLGKAMANVPIAVGSQTQADNNFGVGSELARMFKAFFANNFANEVWGLGVPEPSGAEPATAKITVTSPQTEAGTIHLYVGGQHVPVNISASDTTDEVAATIAERVNDHADLPVTASAQGDDVTLTCVWRGLSGNDIRVDVNYYGTIGGEQTPVGLILTLPPTGFMTNGTGVPEFDTAIANLGEKPFEYVAMPYTDSTSLNAWELEYGFEDVGRWGWRRQLYGHIFSARRGIYPDLLTFGQTRNSGVTSIMGVEKTSPSPVYEWTAAYVAKAQRALTNDPARPLQTLSLSTVKLAPLQDRFDTIELNSLATNGIATQKAGSDNQPMISRESTTYQLNLYGFRDDAYELVTTLATLARLIRNQRHAITSKYPRVKLADDGTRFGPGQAIVTPGIIKGELIAEYVQDMWVGLVENVQAFKANLIVERDPNDPNRVNVLYGPDLINQLRIFAVLAQFRLQYDRGLDTQIIGPNPATIGMTGLLPDFALNG